MLSETDNRLLTEVGPGTPLGRFMRDYWVPVLRSQQLVAGAPPQRLTILGEKLVAFRSPGGQAGVMDEACPHRGASMALARNEECGLRCIYHGWLIDAHGDLMEAPTHPEDAPLHKMRTRSHPVRECQGMIWTWLGGGEAPAFPRLAFTDLPDESVTPITAILNCGWLQPLETLWDTFHAQILHNQTNRNSARADVYFSKNGRKAGELEFDYPEMRTQRTQYGFSYTNSDAAKETNFEFVAPFIQFHTSTPGPTDDRVLQISVPIDDDHCLLWVIFYNRFGPLKAAAQTGGLNDLADLSNFMHGMDHRTPENLWGQDRGSIERGESFAGVHGMGPVTVLAEDVVVIESQGRVDRTRETLSPVDGALIEGRNTVLDAVKAHQAGAAPLGRGLDLSKVEALFVVKPMAAE